MPYRELIGLSGVAIAIPLLAAWGIEKLWEFRKGLKRARRTRV